MAEVLVGGPMQSCQPPGGLPGEIVRRQLLHAQPYASMIILDSCPMLCVLMQGGGLAKLQSVGKVPQADVPESDSIVTNGDCVGCIP